MDDIFFLPFLSFLGYLTLVEERRAAGNSSTNTAAIALSSLIGKKRNTRRVFCTLADGILSLYQEGPREPGKLPRRVELGVSLEI
mgnify:FL=1